MAGNGSKGQVTRPDLSLNGTSWELATSQPDGARKCFGLHFPNKVGKVPLSGFLILSNVHLCLLCSHKSARRIHGPLKNFEEHAGSILRSTVFTSFSKPIFEKVEAINAETAQAYYPTIHENMSSRYTTAAAIVSNE